MANKTPSSSDPWLIKLEPGRFDVGGQDLNITSGVNIAGSGKAVSHIIGRTAFTILDIEGEDITLSSLTIENANGNGRVILATRASSFALDNAKIVTNGAILIQTSGSTGAGTIEIVNSILQISSVGADLRFLDTRQDVNVDSSKFYGNETGTSGLIDNPLGTVRISNSFIEDETNVSGGDGTLVCRGIASPSTFYTNSCPGG